MKAKTVSTSIKLMVFGGSFILLTSCGLFKKKCDCPTWSKNNVEKANEQKA